MKTDSKCKSFKCSLHGFVWLGIVVLAAGLRLAGVFNGLPDRYVIHPDEPKQIVALQSYLADRYLWYRDSWFYDGYPFALNHVDEMALRPLRTVRNAWVSFTAGEAVLPPEWTREQFFGLARGLRVIYGVIVVMLLYRLARQVGCSRGMGLVTMLLGALAPLSVCVTHFATGDIGTDLFSVVMLVCLLKATRASWWWLLGAGMAAGFAFACKYNGLLAVLALVGYVLLWGVRQHLWKWMGKALCAVGVGVVVGAHIATPATFIQWGKTWADIFENFRRIRIYAAPVGSEHQGVFQKLLSAVSNGLPVGSALCWGLLAASLLIGCYLLARLFRTRVREGDAADVQMTALAAIALTPPIALVIAVVGKPRVQPFHFSWMAPFLVLAVVGGGLKWWKAAGRRGKMILALGLALVVGEVGLKSAREYYFWSRDDIAGLRNWMEKESFTPQALMGKGVPRGELRSMVLEPANMAVFRNNITHSIVRVPDMPVWREMGQAPVPCTPYPLSTDWIFLNGPVLPRNDRLFECPANGVVRRELVWHEEPRGVGIGLRSGSLPVEVNLCVGGESRRVRMEPNSAHIEQFDAMSPRWHIANADIDGVLVRVQPIRVAARMGKAWASVLLDDQSRKLFQLFSGELANEMPELKPAAMSWQDVKRAVDRTRYLDSLNLNARLTLDSSRRKQRRYWIGAERVGNVSDRTLALPAGVYRLTCKVSIPLDQCTMKLTVIDPSGAFDVEPSTHQWVVKQGEQDLELVFKKGFAPYECALVLEAEQGIVDLVSWELRPETDRLFDDLAGWEKEGSLPSWMRRFPEMPSPSPLELERKGRWKFGSLLELRGLALPRQVNSGVPLRVACDMQMIRFSGGDPSDLSLFIHFRTPEGHLVYSPGVPVMTALARRASGAAIQCGLIPELAPGDYEVGIGVWNHRLRKRLTLRGDDLTASERKRGVIACGRMRVEAGTKVMDPLPAVSVVPADAEVADQPVIEP